MCPPFHGDQITKPHVCQLVSYNYGDELFNFSGCVFRVNQQTNFPVRYQAPYKDETKINKMASEVVKIRAIFHRTTREVSDRN